ncbi:Nuclear Hormone Receptor family [Caenorhabditis elegans]|uniref:Nuclear Hormone Receptor family n=1 Tax=Caenorhabditis elegans TaxID=6239 RepID=A0A131MCX9_CAEEL|nr:Nuclear Hormone Receptor family [Caenorhabditis elegans]CZR14575.1 Nuclear Hormone Receptor family [Caenorhabditis elegans]|eukprot:NP_001309650.1 Nuclear Hormone Receptor family [Caenorhabditis elegans]
MGSLSSPSTSISTTSSPKLISEKCLVCDQPSHGNHFGVDSCRACAAFFRRVFVTHKQQYKCINELEQCVPDARGRWKCRKCRTDRCFELGMRPDNIQYNRDMFSCTGEFPKQVIYKSTRIIPSKPECITYFDFSSLLESVENILSETTPKCVPFQCQTPLQRLAFGLKEIRKTQLWDNIPVINCIGKEETFENWKVQIERTTTWLSYMDQYRDLNFDDKMTIVQCMWFPFARLERCGMTAKLRKANKCQKNDYAFKSDSLVNTQTVKFDFDWLSHLSNAQMKAFLGDPSEMLCEGLTECMMEIQPTDEELCYILCELCFHHLGRKLGGPMQETMERFLKILSDNLHVYYFEQDRMSRYSHRLLKILKINEKYKTIMGEKRKIVFLGYLFDAFRIKYSHPDFFRFQSFE